ncbi:Tetratricopeptide repeat-like superfamily protein [Hibiscus syriacus]|uniref:Tetratricopeptide repeat-like superfamily protein n=1 Tax=Hibiscus syriacus TaxID=106335 RepID=A0A6A2YM35_HIBSY|nr:transport and Golgi organization 2 homolog [Hibiscus syriacus]KAE8680375.1 Tetratricopeptide repeat-like superfamily protein [Hibiscus syriacus]
MCIAAFVWQAHPRYPLLLLHNRDEYHNRPTKALAWWDVDGCEILGGRDEVAGGTWMACSRQGRVVFLTNVLELHHLHQANTRGELPLLFFKSTKSPMEFAHQLAADAHRYNGFNLIVADIPSKSMVFISNRPMGEPIAIQQVSPGLHVLSNAKLDSPWPKAQRLGKSFKQVLNKYGKNEVMVKEMVEKLTKDKVKADKSKLPGICALDWEFNHSSIFVEMDTPRGLCGTRSSAALIIGAGGEVSFYDKYLDEGVWFERTIDYHLHKLK